MFAYINAYKMGLNDRVNFGNWYEEGRIGVSKVAHEPPTQIIPHFNNTPCIGLLLILPKFTTELDLFSGDEDCPL